MRCRHEVACRVGGIRKTIPKRKLIKKNCLKLKKYFSSFTKIENKKYLKTKKPTVSRQRSFNLFRGKTIEKLYVYIVCNIKPVQTQLILINLMINVCKTPQNFQKLGRSLYLFGLKTVRGIVILVGRLKPIACLVFHLVIKM